MAIYRPVTQPQVIVYGLALFLTGAQGPTVPAGNPVNGSVNQALVAYRESARLIQPAPPNVAATALAVTIGPTIPQDRAAKLGVGQALIAYREPPRLIQPAKVYAIPPAAAVVVAVVIANAPRDQPWPYAQQQYFVEHASILAPSIGTQIPPSPVKQWLTQVPWPYSTALAPIGNAALYAPVVVPPAVTPVIRGGDDVPRRIEVWTYRKKKKAIELIRKIADTAEISEPVRDDVIEAVAAAMVRKNKVFNAGAWVAQREEIIRQILAIQQDDDDEEALLLLI